MAEPIRRSYRWDIEGTKYAIALTSTEKVLLDAIDLRTWHPSHEERH